MDGTVPKAYSDQVEENLQRFGQADTEIQAARAAVKAAKTPATRVLEAANAYSNIANGIENATVSANMALKAAKNAAEMVIMLYFLNDVNFIRD